MFDFYINLSEKKSFMYIEKLLTHVWRIGVPEPVEGTFILMEMCHTVPELVEGSGTRMTLMQQIFTDKICVNLFNPCYSCTIKIMNRTR